MKPIIQEESIISDIDGVDDVDWKMLAIRCGKCGELFGLTTGDNSDLKYFREHYNFCNKCGTSVHWC